MPTQGAVRIPGLDTILPYKCRAKKCKVERDPEFMKDVPEQYRQGIRDQIAADGRAQRSTVKPPHSVKNAKDEKSDDEDDKKNVKQELTDSPPAVERASPAEPRPVFINSFGSLSKGDIGPRAVLGAWRTDESEAAVVPPAEPARDIEERFRAAHTLHLKKEAIKRRPAAAAKRPAAALHPLVAAVRAHRVRRRLRGKQSRPGAWAGQLDPDLIKAKLETSSSMAVFQSWAYHKVRKTMVRDGYSDACAKAMASTWHRKLKEMWLERHGAA